ncbi:MAG TPA: MCE family protein [Sporichthyaceae bacterium]|nr:MCE family protein [Sporichthyaceae bacterium]
MRQILQRSTAGVAVLAGLLCAGCVPFVGGDHITLSAVFTESVGVYPGNTVDVLGVPVGRVTKVTPQGTSVLVRMSVTKSQPIPADAGALIIPPSVIADRYVELSPVWKAGPRMADGAVIPLARTRTPVEFDRIIRALDKLATSFTSDQKTVGAIRDALGVAASNLKGNGLKIHQSIEGLSAAIGTLADNRDDISGLVRSLDGLAGAFARNDATVRAFSKNVTDATAVLAGNGDQLNKTLNALSTAVTEVAAFVKKNQSAAKGTLEDLTAVLSVLNAHRQQLTEALDVLPLTFQNLAMAVSPKNQRMVGNASAASNILNPVIAQQFCDSFGPFLCPNAGKPIGSISDAFGPRGAR